jgi:TetR/AcrR family acrAB operon transcriptional repressor
MKVAAKSQARAGGAGKGTAPEAPQRRTQAERRQESERRLLDAGVSLLVERGFDRFALADVGELAGYSRGLAGHHFENKEGLLVALANYIVNGFAKGVEREPRVAAGWGTVARGIRYYTSSAKRNPLFFRAYMIILAEAALHPKLKALAADVHRRAIEQIVASLEEGKASGEISPTAHTKLNAETIYAFQRGLLTLLRIGGDLETEAITENFIAAMEAHLLAPRPAHKKP